MLTLDRVAVAQGSFSVTADCQFAPGVTAILGPSGCGKSTILSGIAGFLPLTKGEMAWRGERFDAKAPGARPVSVLFQDNNLFPHLTLAQNVGLGLRPDLRFSKADNRRIADALEQVGLDGLGHRKPGAVSGGQQSRAALARILLSARSVVLLDEPFAALGPAMKQEILHLTRQHLAVDDRVILMVTHDADDARAIADQVSVLSDGALSAPVGTTEIFDAPPAALRQYLGKSSSENEGVRGRKS